MGHCGVGARALKSFETSSQFRNLVAQKRSNSKTHVPAMCLRLRSGTLRLKIQCFRIFFFTDSGVALQIPVQQVVIAIQNWDCVSLGAPVVAIAFSV